MSRTRILTCFGLLFFVSACSSSPKLSQEQKEDYNRWYAEVRAKIEPVWKNQIKAGVKKNLKSEEEGRKFKADLPNLYSRFAVIVDLNGKILVIKKTHESTYPFLDKAGTEAIYRSSPLPAPPVSLLRNSTAQLNWEFRVAR